MLAVSNVFIFVALYTERKLAMVSSKAIHISTFNQFIVTNKAIVIKIKGFSHFTQYNLAFGITLRGCEEVNLEGKFDSLHFKKPGRFERACKVSAHLLNWLN